MSEFSDFLIRLGAAKLLASYLCISAAIYCVMEISDWSCWSLFDDRGLVGSDSCLKPWFYTWIIMFVWLLTALVVVSTIRSEVKSIKQARIIIITLSALGLILEGFYWWSFTHMMAS